MAAVRKLKTQTEAFWRDEYQISDSDLDLIAGVILEAGKPQRLDTLVATVIMRRYQREKEAMTRQAKSGQLYQPKGTYQIGQEVIFSALGYAVGRVTDVRQGHNPKYGEFQVIRVLFENELEREYAAAFDHPHPLNRPLEELLGSADPAVSESEMVRLFEHYVARRLEPALESNSEFVYFDGVWFLRELLPEIHVGHLNLAEAMIYEAGHPLVAREMLGELDLPAASSSEAQLFALNHALGKDERFDNVSLSDEPVWYLRALEPAAVAKRPDVLKPAFRAAGGEYLGITLLDFVEEVGDELDDVESLTLRQPEGIQFEVNFPHLYAGTMPATQRFLRLLPPTSSHHLSLTMVDDKTGQRYEVWAVPDERYICGLSNWYTAVGMCVGGQVSVSPAGAPLTFSISAQPIRSKKTEWVRSASVSDEGLALQMQRSAIGVKCDRNTFVDVPDREAIARLMAQTERAQLSLTSLIRTAFEELAKLSSRGIVHAKSIYSAVNLMRRSGTVPIFAELTRHACYDPVGDGSWAYDPSLAGQLYRTPDEMRERPFSKRQDLIRDQVVQYLGR